MTLHALPAPGSKANPFPNLREAQKRGFCYFAKDAESGLLVVRLSVNRGGLHFMLGFALPDDSGSN